MTQDSISIIGKERLDPYLKHKMDFRYSAGKLSEVREGSLDEFCIIGRSNVGKSSFLNHVMNNSTLARVSKKPGKTNLANFFSVGPDMTWVDMPGYGYATASHKEKDRWSQLIDDYCAERTFLKGIIWLLDIRHPGTKADLVAAQWLAKLSIPILPVLTKADKLTKNETAKSISEYKKIFGFEETPFCYTTSNYACREAFLAHFLEWRDSLDEDLNA